MMSINSSPPPTPQREQGGEDVNDISSQLQTPVDSNHPESYTTSQSLPAPNLNEGTSPHFAAPVRQVAPPRRTDHTYHDYATQIPSPYEFPITKKSTSNFPAKLHKMVSDLSNAQAIQWQPHGRAWKVLDKELLVNVVIPKYFVQTKYESFTRQLSGWGFKRLHQTGPDYRCYYHECFLRGLPHLTRMMKRVEPYQGKLLPDAEAEPNFYEMQLVHPLPPPPAHSRNVQAGAEPVGMYPHAQGGHPPGWIPSTISPYGEPHPYGQYHGHGFPPPGSYPPPPHPHEAYPYTYPHPQTLPPFEQHPVYSPQHREYMAPPYFGGNPPVAAAGMPTQMHPAPRQPPPYINPHAYNIHHPNQNAIGSHSMSNQPGSLNHHDTYPREEQQPAWGNASYYGKDDRHHQEPDQQHYSGY